MRTDVQPGMTSSEAWHGRCHRHDVPGRVVLFVLAGLRAWGRRRRRFRCLIDLAPSGGSPDRLSHVVQGGVSRVGSAVEIGAEVAGTATAEAVA
jgi:hypothetical protein